MRNSTPAGTYLPRKPGYPRPVKVPLTRQLAPPERRHITDIHIETQYSTGASRQAIEQALVAAGKDLNHIRPEDLALLEDFHTMGRIATTQLAGLAQITPGDEVLDAAAESAEPPATSPDAAAATSPPWISPRNTVRPHGGSTSLPGLTTGSACAKETSRTCRSRTRPSP